MEEIIQPFTFSGREVKGRVRFEQKGVVIIVEQN